MSHGVMVLEHELEHLADVLTSDLPYRYDPEFLSRLTLADFNQLWNLIENKRFMADHPPQHVDRLGVYGQAATSTVL